MPRTITVSETVQKDVEITVPQLQYVDREIRIPEQVMETKTVRVPRQRIVIEEEEVTIPLHSRFSSYPDTLLFFLVSVLPCD